MTHSTYSINASDSRRKMNPKAFWTYLPPIVVGILLLAGLLVLYWQVESSREERSMRFPDMWHRRATQAVAVVETTLPLSSAPDSSRGEQYRGFLEDLMATFRLDFAILFHDKDWVCQMGTPPAGLPIETARGSRILGESLVCWCTVSRSAAGKEYLLCEDPPAVAADSMTVVLGVPPPWRQRRGGEPPFPGPPFLLPPPHVVGITLLMMLIVIFSLTWVLVIRSRMLKTELGMEKARSSFLEDLGLAAAGLAHETRNPLGIVRGFAQRIANSPETTDDNRKMAGNILEAVDRACSRLSDFLAYAKPRGPDIAVVDGIRVLEKVRSVMGPEFERRGVKLVLGVTPGCPGSLMADGGMFQQLIVNLLLNSLCASKSRSTVSVALERHGKKGVLMVRDHGEGIPAELLPRVFKPYVTGRADGHGLGLAIVRQIADHHGWSIDIDSKPSRGTTVTISDIVIPNPSEERS